MGKFLRIFTVLLVLFIFGEGTDFENYEEREIDKRAVSATASVLDFTVVGSSTIFLESGTKKEGFYIQTGDGFSNKCNADDEGVLSFGICGSIVGDPKSCSEYLQISRSKIEYEGCTGKGEYNDLVLIPKQIGIGKVVVVKDSDTIVNPDNNLNYHVIVMPKFTVTYEDTTKVLTVEAEEFTGCPDDYEEDCEGIESFVAYTDIVAEQLSFEVVKGVPKEGENPTYVFSCVSGVCTVGFDEDDYEVLYKVELKYIDETYQHDISDKIPVGMYTSKKETLNIELSKIDDETPVVGLNEDEKAYISKGDATFEFTLTSTSSEPVLGDYKYKVTLTNELDTKYELSGLTLETDKSTLIANFEDAQTIQETGTYTIEVKYYFDDDDEDPKDSNFGTNNDELYVYEPSKIKLELKWTGGGEKECEFDDTECVGDDIAGCADVEIFIKFGVVGSNVIIPLAEKEIVGKIGETDILFDEFEKLNFEGVAIDEVDTGDSTIITTLKYQFQVKDLNTFTYKFNFDGGSSETEKTAKITAEDPETLDTLVLTYCLVMGSDCTTPGDDVKAGDSIRLAVTGTGSVDTCSLPYLLDGTKLSFYDGESNEVCGDGIDNYDCEKFESSEKQYTITYDIVIKKVGDYVISSEYSDDGSKVSTIGPFSVLAGQLHSVTISSEKNEVVTDETLVIEFKGKDKYENDVTVNVVDISYSLYECEDNTYNTCTEDKTSLLDSFAKTGGSLSGSIADKGFYKIIAEDPSASYTFGVYPKVDNFKVKVDSEYLEAGDERTFTISDASSSTELDVDNIKLIIDDNDALAVCSQNDNGLDLDCTFTLDTASAYTAKVSYLGNIKTITEDSSDSLYLDVTGNFEILDKPKDFVVLYDDTEDIEAGDEITFTITSDEVDDHSNEVNLDNTAMTLVFYEKDCDISSCSDDCCDSKITPDDITCTGGENSLECTLTIETDGEYDIYLQYRDREEEKPTGTGTKRTIKILSKPNNFLIETSDSETEYEAGTTITFNITSNADRVGDKTGTDEYDNPVILEEDKLILVFTYDGGDFEFSTVSTDPLSCNYHNDGSGDLKYKLDCDLTIKKKGNPTISIKYGSRSIDTISGSVSSLTILDRPDNFKIAETTKDYEAGSDITFTISSINELSDGDDEYENHIELEEDKMSFKFIKQDETYDNCIESCSSNDCTSGDDSEECIACKSECEKEVAYEYVEGKTEYCTFVEDNELECKFKIIGEYTGEAKIVIIYRERITSLDSSSIDSINILDSPQEFKVLFTENEEGAAEAGEKVTFTIETTEKDAFDNLITLVAGDIELIFTGVDVTDCVNDELFDDSCAYQFNNGDEDENVDCALAENELGEEIPTKLECSFTITHKRKYDLSIRYRESERTIVECFDSETAPCTNTGSLAFEILDRPDNFRIEGMKEKYEIGSEITFTISSTNDDQDGEDEYGNEVVLDEEKMNFKFVNTGCIDAECLSDCSDEESPECIECKLSNEDDCSYELKDSTCTVVNNSNLTCTFTIEKNELIGETDYVILYRNRIALFEDGESGQSITVLDSPQNFVISFDRENLIAEAGDEVTFTIETTEKDAFDNLITLDGEIDFTFKKDNCTGDEHFDQEECHYSFNGASDRDVECEEVLAEPPLSTYHKLKCSFTITHKYDDYKMFFKYRGEERTICSSIEDCTTPLENLGSFEILDRPDNFVIESDVEYFEVGRDITFTVSTSETDEFENTVELEGEMEFTFIKSECDEYNTCMETCDIVCDEPSSEDCIQCILDCDVTKDACEIIITPLQEDSEGSPVLCNKIDDNTLECKFKFTPDSAFKGGVDFSIQYRNRHATYDNSGSISPITVLDHPKEFSVDFENFKTQIAEAGDVVEFNITSTTIQDEFLNDIDLVAEDMKLVFTSEECTSDDETFNEQCEYNFDNTCDSPCDPKIADRKFECSKYSEPENNHKLKCSFAITYAENYTYSIRYRGYERCIGACPVDDDLVIESDPETQPTTFTILPKLENLEMYTKHFNDKVHELYCEANDTNTLHIEVINPNCDSVEHDDDHPECGKDKYKNTITFDKNNVVVIFDYGSGTPLYSSVFNEEGEDVEACDENGCIPTCTPDEDSSYLLHCEVRLKKSEAYDVKIEYIGLSKAVNDPGFTYNVLPKINDVSISLDGTRYLIAGEPYDELKVSTVDTEESGNDVFDNPLYLDKRFLNIYVKNTTAGYDESCVIEDCETECAVNSGDFLTKCIHDCEHACDYKFNHVDDKVIEYLRNDTNEIVYNFTVVNATEYQFNIDYFGKPKTIDYKFKVFPNIISKVFIPDETIAEKGEEVTLEVISYDRYDNLVDPSTTNLTLEVSYQSQMTIKKYNMNSITGCKSDISCVDSSDPACENICDLVPNTFTFVIEEVYNPYLPNPYYFYVIDNDHYVNDNDRYGPKLLFPKFGNIVSTVVYDNLNGGDKVEGPSSTTVSDETKVYFEAQNQYGYYVPYQKCDTDSEIVTVDKNPTSSPCYKSGHIQNPVLKYYCKSKRYEYSFTAEKKTQENCVVTLDFYQTYDEDGDLTDGNTFQIEIMRGGITDLKILEPKDSTFVLGDSFNVVVVAERNGRTIEINEDEIAIEIEGKEEYEYATVDGKAIVEIDDINEVGKHDITVTLKSDNTVTTTSSFNYVYGTVKEITGSYAPMATDEGECSELGVCVVGSQIKLTVDSIKNINDEDIPIDATGFEFKFILNCNFGGIEKELDNFEVTLEEITTDCKFVADVTENGENYQVVVKETEDEILTPLPFNIERGDIVSFKVNGLPSGSVEEVSAEAGETKEIVVDGFMNNYIEVDLVDSDTIEIEGDYTVLNNQIIITFKSDEVGSYDISITIGDVNTVTLTVNVDYGNPDSLTQENSVKVYGDDGEFTFKLYNQFGILISKDDLLLSINGEEGNPPTEGTYSFTLDESSVDVVGDNNVEVTIDGIFSQTITVTIERGEITSLIANVEASDTLIAGEGTYKFSLQVENEHEADITALVTSSEFGIVVDLDESLYTIQNTEGLNFVFDGKIASQFTLSGVTIEKDGSSIDLSSPVVFEFTEGTISKLEYIIRKEDSEVTGPLVANDQTTYTLFLLAKNEYNRYINSNTIKLIDNGGLTELVSTIKELESHHGLNHKFDAASFNLTISRAGEYDLAFGIDQVMNGGRFKIVVVPDHVDPTKSSASGNGVVLVHASKAVTLTIALRDKYSNAIQYNEDEMTITAKIGSKTTPLALEVVNQKLVGTYVAPSEGEDFELSLYIYTEQLGTDKIISSAYTVALISPDKVPTIPGSVGEGETFEVDGDFELDEPIEVSGVLIFNSGSNVNVSSNLIGGGSSKRADRPLITVLEGGHVELAGTLVFTIESQENIDYLNETSTETMKRDDEQPPKQHVGKTLVIVDGQSTGSFAYKVENAYNSCVIITPVGHKENQNSDALVTFIVEEDEACRVVKEKTLKGYAIAGIVLGVLVIAALIAIIVLIVVIKKPFSKSNKSSSSSGSSNSYEMKPSAQKEEGGYRGHETTEESSGGQEVSEQESDQEDESYDESDDRQEDSDEESDVQEDSSEVEDQSEGTQDSTEGSDQEGSSDEGSEEES